jgi:hypothetical protein
MLKTSDVLNHPFIKQFQEKSLSKLQPVDWSSYSSTEVNLLKRYIRILKNRESAYLSRKRRQKQELVFQKKLDSLQQHKQTLDRELIAIKAENTVLQQQYAQLAHLLTQYMQRPKQHPLQLHPLLMLPPKKHPFQSLPPKQQPLPAQSPTQHPLPPKRHLVQFTSPMPMTVTDRAHIEAILQLKYGVEAKLEVIDSLV